MKTIHRIGRWTGRVSDHLIGWLLLVSVALNLTQVFTRYALNDPVWGIWFGRKCCLPASPLYPTVGGSAAEALSGLAEKIGLDLGGEGISTLQTYREEDAGDVTFWNDDPVSFGEREFRSRPVRRVQDGLT